MATHLVAFYTTTTGLNGPSLGSDEEDIVLIQILVFDIAESQVLTEQQYIVRPAGSDVNANVLSEQCREYYGLTEEQVKNGQSLQSVIDSIEVLVNKLEETAEINSNNNTNNNNAISTIDLITDGQLHLRQVLHPKAVAKGMELPSFFHRFFDLRKEFKSFYHISNDVSSVKEMLDYSDLTADNSSNLAVKTVRDMVRIVKEMSNEGHRFAMPEMINIRLEPGICTRSEEVDSGCVVRARGLPWQSSDQDIAKFFRGLNINKGGVALCLSPQGRRNGEALVRFVSAEHRDMALKRHKHHIGNRYIEVYKATGDDFINVAGGNNNEAQQFLSRGGQVIIRMRGLPYDCNAKQVVDFFDSGENGCQILDGEDGVLFVRKPDGRATGDAFVLFASEEDSSKALSKHREIIGQRYIELFRSTTAEVQQVLNRSMDPRTYEPQQPLIGQIPQLPILPQQFITTSSRRDCIRLRGLPYEAQVEHVLEFLGDFAKNIVFRGVHMVINAQGQPSGEAFIQMDNEQSAFLAAQNRHNRYMIFGKKQRYIEVFQCSGEDMNLVLSGGIPAQRTVVSPGMLIWDQSAGASPQIPQGTPSPHTIFSTAPRPPIPGTVLSPPSYPQTFPTTPNGTYSFQGLVPAHVKPEQVFVSNQVLSTQLRPQLLQQNHFEAINQASQQQSAAAALVQSLKYPMAAAAPSQMMHPALIGQYGEMGIASGHAVPPGMFFVQSPKLPSVSQSPGLPPQMTFVSVNSAAPDVRKTSQNFQQPKCYYSTASLLPMPYATATVSAPSAIPRIRLPTVSSVGKRSFEQAFTGEKSNSIRPMKRPPPARIPNQVLTQTVPAMSAPRITNPPPHLSASHIQAAAAAAAAAAHLTPGAPQPTINGAAIPTPMISALYPPPQMYPPAI